MLVKVSDLQPVHCQILGWGHAEVGDDSRLVKFSQADFIRHIMSEQARAELFGEVVSVDDSRIEAEAAKWIEAISTHERPFFLEGSTSELGTIAARKCLDTAGVSMSDIDLIIGATNTGPEYPSLSDEVMAQLGAECKQARCFDVQEACVSGSIAIDVAAGKVRSGEYRKALVVCAERASLLAPYDEFMRSNLFGDSAFAVLLAAGEKEDFVFFDFRNNPHDGRLDLIRKINGGFVQDGRAVHNFVVKEITQNLVTAVEQAGIEPRQIDHMVAHQPSGRTMDRFERRVRFRWKDFDGIWHRNLETMGNTSSASTGWLISAGIASNQIRPGQLVVVCTFGAGLSSGFYAFRA